ncbi:TlpA family protein disulfide reductase [Nocardioides terrisoli]|uniref:TlpA family protein disulfide reductase n=1 Tax=Nocardioides terrisoli TaxID=3388267 RepID=UPI00287B60B7|nr:redoxin domain-containing protein [Nocardioides marmorisolisilvae]
MSAQRWGIVGVLMLVVALVVGLGVAMDRHPSEAAGASMQGRPAPELRGTTLDGKAFRLRPGHVTIVNVWASWCAPCRQELPTLAALARSWRSRGVRLVTIDTRDGPAAARSLLAEVHARGILAVRDPHGRLAVDWGATGVPETVVLDARGVVRARWLGAISREWLDGKLKAVAGEGS